LPLERLHPPERCLRLQNVQPSTGRVTTAPHPTATYSRPENDGLNDPCVGAQLAAVFQSYGNSLRREFLDRLQRVRGEPEERSIEASTKTLPRSIVVVISDIQSDGLRMRNAMKFL
jgi:hypothetical protein